MLVYAGGDVFCDVRRCSLSCFLKMFVDVMLRSCVGRAFHVAVYCFVKCSVLC